MCMEKRYVKAKELKLRRLISGFFTYLDSPYDEYAREIINEDSIPTLGREVNFTVNTNNVVLIRYTDDSNKTREIHVAIPKGALLKTGYDFSFTELHNAIVRGIHSSTDSFEIVRDEATRFKYALGESNEDGLLISDYVEELHECSTSAYFSLEDEILTLETTILTPRAYATTKVRFLHTSEDQ